MSDFFVRTPTYITTQIMQISLSTSNPFKPRFRSPQLKHLFNRSQQSKQFKPCTKRCDNNNNNIPVAGFKDILWCRSSLNDPRPSHSTWHHHEWVAETAETFSRRQSVAGLPSISAQCRYSARLIITIDPGFQSIDSPQSWHLPRPNLFSLAHQEQLYYENEGVETRFCTDWSHVMACTMELKRASYMTLLRCVI